MSDEGQTLDGAIPPARNTRLFGHDEAVTFLSKAYQTGTMHHAILLEGPEGIGKATLAYRFAYHMLTHADPLAAPASVSDPDLSQPLLRQIASGASHNLLHLARPVDAKTGRIKSSITIEEVRRAGHFLSQTSGTGNWRVVIVDTADDMNRSAANAILKILEEPPKKTVFFVLSHIPGRLLPTIRSRCMPLRLKPLDDAAMRMGLEHLGLTSGQDRAVVDGVIARSDGSLAHAILLLRYGGLEIAERCDAILSEGKGQEKKAVHALADTLAARDREQAYRYFVAYALDHASRHARDAATAGDLISSAHWAKVTAELQQSATSSDIYNLDRKQTVISAFSLLFQSPTA
ncbi:MAG: DNA polymerase III subunit delta' [Pseudomonadota bacterium]